MGRVALCLRYIREQPVWCKGGRSLGEKHPVACGRKRKRVEPHVLKSVNFRPSEPVLPANMGGTAEVVFRP